eukprot:jgi/Psemu1/291086/fgenesh1_pg.618_\
MWKFENSSPGEGLIHAYRNLPDHVYNAVVRTIAYRFVSVPKRECSASSASSTSISTSTSATGAQPQRTYTPRAQVYMDLLQSANSRLAGDPFLLVGLKCAYCASQPRHIQGCVSFVRMGQGEDMPTLVANAIHQRMMHLRSRCPFAMKTHGGDGEIKNLFGTSFHIADVHLNRFCKEWVKEWDKHKEQPLAVAPLALAELMPAKPTTVPNHWEGISWSIFNPPFAVEDDTDEADEYFRLHSTTAAGHQPQQQQQRQHQHKQGEDGAGTGSPGLKPLPPPKANPEYCLPIQPHQLAQCPDGVPYARDTRPDYRGTAVESGWVKASAVDENIQCLLGVRTTDVVVAGEECPSAVARSLHDRSGNRRFFRLVSEHRSHYYGRSASSSEESSGESSEIDEDEWSAVVATILEEVNRRGGRFLEAGSPRKGPRKATEEEAMHYIRYRLEEGFPDILDPNRHTPRLSLSCKKQDATANDETKDETKDIDIAKEHPPSKVLVVEHAPKIGLVTGVLEWDILQDAVAVASNSKLLFSDLRRVTPPPSPPSPSAAKTSPKKLTEDTTGNNNDNDNNNIHGKLNGTAGETEASSPAPAPAPARAKIASQSPAKPSEHTTNNNNKTNIQGNLNLNGTAGDTKQSETTRREAAVATQHQQGQKTQAIAIGDTPSITVAVGSESEPPPAQASAQASAEQPSAEQPSAEQPSAEQPSAQPSPKLLQGARGYDKKRNHNTTCSTAMEEHHDSPQLPKRARSEDVEVIDISSDPSE